MSGLTAKGLASWRTLSRAAFTLKLGNCKSCARTAITLHNPAVWEQLSVLDQLRCCPQFFSCRNNMQEICQCNLVMQKPLKYNFYIWHGLIFVYPLRRLSGAGGTHDFIGYWRFLRPLTRQVVISGMAVARMFTRPSPLGCPVGIPTPRRLPASWFLFCQAGVKCVVLWSIRIIVRYSSQAPSVRARRC